MCIRPSPEIAKSFGSLFGQLLDFVPPQIIRLHLFLYGSSPGFFCSYFYFIFFTFWGPTYPNFAYPKNVNVAIFHFFLEQVCQLGRVFLHSSNQLVICIWPEEVCPLHSRSHDVSNFLSCIIPQDIFILISASGFSSVKGFMEWGC